MSDLYNVECTAVPDGLLEDQKVKYARISVVLRPEPHDAPLPGNVEPIELSQWPTAIKKLNFEVSFSGKAGDWKKIDTVITEFDPPGFDTEAIHNADAAAESWWKTVWDTAPLRDAFRQLMQRSAKSATKFETYSYALLADLAYARIASDIAVSTMAAQKEINKAKLTRRARARLANPNAASIRVMDAVGLSKREIYAGLDLGDAFSRAILEQDPVGRSFDIDEALDKIFEDIRKSIDGEIGVKRSLGDYTTASVRSWNPFLSGPQISTFAEKSNLEDRFADEIFGAQDFQIASGKVPGARRTFYGMEAFRRLMLSEKEKGTVSTKRPITEQDNAARRIANLQAHPALRKFARLIVDLRVPLDEIPSDVRANKWGIVSVRARPETNPERGFCSETWFETAFEIDEGEMYFEPCPEWQYHLQTADPLLAEDAKPTTNPSVVPSLPLDRGIVQLNIGTGGARNNGTHRFRLEIIDAIAATISHERAVATMVSGLRNGFPLDKVVSDEPSARTRGIMLLDTESLVSAHVTEQRKVEKAGIKKGEANLQFAEDLVDGYRIDMVSAKPIRVTEPGGKTVDRRAFPAGARTLSYDVIVQAFGGKNPYPDYADRDEGYIRTPSRVVPITLRGKNGTTVNEERRVTSEVLVTLTGANLGLPSPPPPDFGKKQRADRPSDVKVKVTYSFSSEAGPILRDGAGYFILAKPRKSNGGSVSAAYAERYLKHALGSPDGGPFIFKHVERTPAPIVLVPKGQTLVLPDKEGEQPSPLSMVAITDASPDASVRMLVSPSIGFNHAEQQGQFDYRFSDTAGQKLGVKRAGFGSYRTLRQEKRGGFPPYTDAGGEKAQALLFELVEPPTHRPKVPHFVDCQVWSLKNLLRPTGYSTAFDIETGSVADIGFWTSAAGTSGKFSPEDIVPIRLEVVALDGTSKSRVVRAANLKLGSGRASVTVPVLRVEVGRGDTFELELWTDRLVEAFRTHPATLRMKSLPDPSSLVAEPFRVAAVQEMTKLRISHPVQLPLETPRMLSLGAVRCDQKAWIESDGRLRDDQADHETSIVWGKIAFDRKTTAVLWADCRWRVVDPALVLRRTTKDVDPNAIEQTALYRYAPNLVSGKLFILTDIPPLQPREGETKEEFLERANTIDLSRDESGTPRALAGDFRSSKARKIVARIVARSRFAPASNTPTDFTNSVTSAPDDVFEHYAQYGGLRPDGVRDFWLPATRAPVVPVLTRNYGIAYRRRFDTTESLLPGQSESSLTHVYRCWLDNRWFDSGPFEKLAVICRPLGTDTPAWLEPLLSKWGGDMTMRSGQPLGGTGKFAAFLAPEQFVLDDHHDVDFESGEVIPSILRNIPLQSPTGTESRNVDIALLEPKFDAGAGLWFCDIELKNAPAFKIDLDLSLARYQHHAIPGCHLSKPIAAGGFMLHQPWSFKATRSNDRVDITVIGPAYSERAPMTRGLKTLVPRDVSQRAGMPFLTAELERIVDGSPLPVRGVDGLPVVTTSRNATKIDSGGLGVPPGCTRWIMSLAIPHDPIHRDHLAVRVSLSSYHANSLAALGETRDGGLITLPEPMTAQLIIGD
ncbi:MAG: hypothetical protein KJ670_21850 [Alphaproteobacteria bacterium]|nr:hypothetical protein [Rhizobiaceae bacterium]MBU3962070.1 hypothetical protein [Alphaproteobacteria bacterium]MBU4048139.1 hypothetical protein [Alphaproteobacteria bacterium]MBU4091369.1 hypothetical protein [Alphaproteobacteria bacterium]MBU4159074.1 hypothetical protein [Alphaproteobacteria bacterium]